jgi:hypothetical protein
LTHVSAVLGSELDRMLALEDVFKHKATGSADRLSRVSPLPVQ